MDSPSVTHLSLCSGYGGIDLGIRRCIPNMRTVAYAEIEAFACELLLARMEGGQLDAAPIWTDLKSFPWGKFSGLVDILSGGYPCQPFSSAGRRRGQDDPRHLWPFIADGIRLLLPQVCFFENVEGHITLGLRDVLHDLAGMGYRTTWGLFSAAECGAPHQRKRVFILAHATSVGRRKDNWFGNPKLADENHAFWPSRPSQPQFAWEPPRVVANTRGKESTRLPQPEGWDEGTKAGESGEAMGNAKNGDKSGNPLHLRPREAQYRGTSGCFDSRRRQTQPALGGDADGSAGRVDYAELCISGDSRVDELRLLGNGVVPATAELAFRTLRNELFSETTN